MDVMGSADVYRVARERPAPAQLGRVVAVLEPARDELERESLAFSTEGTKDIAGTAFASFSPTTRRLQLAAYALIIVGMIVFFVLGFPVTTPR